MTDKPGNSTIDRRSLLLKSAAALGVSPLIANQTLAASDTASAAGRRFNWRRPGSNNTYWASGGTKSMCAPFPPRIDPFRSGLGNTCVLTEETIVGPCYFDAITTADDISEGELGIPMTVVLKVVDANCQPVRGAVVEAWWANRAGVYSADTTNSTNGIIEGLPEIPDDIPEGELPPPDTSVGPFVRDVCVLNADPEMYEAALESQWMRGIKESDRRGNVYFKGCFTGWYQGRSPHIHVRVVLENEQRLVTQLGFDEEMANDIYLNHPEYTGVPSDTPHANDFLFGNAENLESLLFETRRQFDGSMLAWRALQLPV